MEIGYDERTERNGGGKGGEESKARHEWAEWHVSID